MQYINKKNTPPEDWNLWFTRADGIRSYDYGQDYSSLTNLSHARAFLVEEQNNLCAYCQQQINIRNSSIEHVIPKELNKALSTNYYNLVAVCKDQVKDISTGKKHCDKEKGNSIITPIIFFSDAEVSDERSSKYFCVYSSGWIEAKHSLTGVYKQQVEAFIEILNLNHQVLLEKREKDVLDGIIQASLQVNILQRKNFWKTQYRRIMNKRNHPFRQFLLIHIGNKIGIN